MDAALPADRFTVLEAAWAADSDDRFVNQEVDAEIVEVEARRRVLATHDVLYFSVLRTIAAQFARELRKRIYVGIRDAEARNLPQVMLAPHFCLHLAEPRRTVALRTGRIVAARGGVEAVAGVRGAAPVVRGTRVPVSTLAAMVAAGAALDELAVQYDLDKSHIRLALLYDRLHPPEGAGRSGPMTQPGPAWPASVCGTSKTLARCGRNGVPGARRVRGEVLCPGRHALHRAADDSRPGPWPPN